MVVLQSTGASRYHNVHIDGGTSPEEFGLALICSIAEGRAHWVWWSGNTRQAYSGDVWFESRPSRWLSSQVPRGSVGSCKLILITVLRLDHGCFVSKPFTIRFISLTAWGRVRSLQRRHCTYNLTLCRVRVMFIPPRPPWQPDAISVEESALRFCCKVPDILPDFN
jgi:hypothetical protein